MDLTKVKVATEPHALGDRGPYAPSPDPRGPLGLRALTGENAVGLSGVTFTVGSNGRADKVRVENLNTTGLGTFTRND
ncbi:MULTISPECIES: hypothetical protein [unclassified Streptomyces]|uniref:hypothetical protein n=1 Tax=unclassified Streptomyces TaxID=2593676 RepID=UPI0024755FDA|nr:hypothetical protein [Streptomyces sp. SAI-119]